MTDMVALTMLTGKTTGTTNCKKIFKNNLADY